jgi:hypothetical protein
MNPMRQVKAIMEFFRKNATVIPAIGQSQTMKIRLLHFLLQLACKAK